MEWLPAPDLPWGEYSLLERELAARKAGLRTGANEPHPVAPPDSTFFSINPPVPKPGALSGSPLDSTILGINPPAPEPAVPPGSPLDSTILGINPPAPQPTVAPGSRLDSTTPGINPPAPKPGALFGSTHHNPFKIALLCSTTPSETWKPNLRSVPATRFGPPPPPPGWFAPQAWPLKPGIETLLGRTDDKSPIATTEREPRTHTRRDGS
jgi:hypothetical protein